MHRSVVLALCLALVSACGGGPRINQELDLTLLSDLGTIRGTADALCKCREMGSPDCSEQVSACEEALAAYDTHTEGLDLYVELGEEKRIAYHTDYVGLVSKINSCKAPLAQPSADSAAPDAAPGKEEPAPDAPVPSP